jgi:prolyl-tRNA synthetase
LVMARRDIPGKAGKSFVPQTQISTQVAETLLDIHNSLYKRAVEFRDNHISEPRDYEEFKQIVQNGWAFSWWCGSRECETKIKEETRATIRNIPFDQPGGAGKCIYCGEPAHEKVYFAKAY